MQPTPQYGNSPMLAAQVTEAGGAPQIGAVQPDDPAALATAVTRAARDADLVLLIAGSSSGRRDHAPAVLAETGGLVVHGVAVRPGHPALLGFTRPAQPRGRQAAGAVPVIGIPGYPLAALAIFELFAVPLLAALQDTKPPERPRKRAQLTCDWTSSPDVEDCVPVSLASQPARTDQPVAALATPGRRGAGAISRLVRADAWWPIPIGQAKFSEGEHIDVQPIAGVPAELGSLTGTPPRRSRHHPDSRAFGRRGRGAVRHSGLAQPRASCTIRPAVAVSGSPRPTVAPSRKAVSAAAAAAACSPIGMAGCGRPR